MMSDKNYLSVYAKSFNWAGFFLPKKTYKKCSALYDFCRVADNIADDEEKLEVKEIKFKKRPFNLFLQSCWNCWFDDGKNFKS